MTCKPIRKLDISQSVAGPHCIREDSLLVKTRDKGNRLNRNGSGK